MITRLVLTNFRNLPRFEVADLPAQGVVALVGPNGVGKTSVLEALSLLDGSRGLVDDDPKAMVREGAAREGFGMFVEGNFGTTGLAYRAGKREVRVDGSDANLDDLAARHPVVAMAPELDRMFYEAPGERRALLDGWAAQVNPLHTEAAERYKQHGRNRLRILLQGGTGDWLEAEEQQAAMWGVKLLEGRAAYMAAVQPHLEGLTLALGGAAQEVLKDANPVAALKGKLERSREIDTRLERTSAGPNTLDVVARLTMNGQEVVAKQSSSGQHKRVMLRWLAGQVRLLQGQGTIPLVLVDELGAHLDAQGKAEALAMLQGLNQQVWISDVALEDSRVRMVGLK